MNNRTQPPFPPAYESDLKDTIHHLLAIFHKDPSQHLVYETFQICYETFNHGFPNSSSLHIEARTTEKIISDPLTALMDEVYYNENDDKSIIEMYYKNLPIHEDPLNELNSKLTELLSRTHNPQLSYSNSRKALHSWVDLREDGEIKSIYSGQNLNQSILMEQDKLLEDTAIQHMKQVLEKNDFILNEHKDILIESILRTLQFNVEHVIPQSWFAKRHPMVGDLHHLFTCETNCNSFRSNIPYFDFEDYKPRAYKEVIKNSCGKRDGNEKFEPENGKGEIARACLYFLLRYPDVIIQEKKALLDINLYKKWHQDYPVTLHEKHRNWTIFKLQGNRNPYIDFPELVLI